LTALKRLLTESEIETEYAFGVKQYEIDYGWCCQDCLSIWEYKSGDSMSFKIAINEYISHDCFQARIALDKQQVLF